MSDASQNPVSQALANLSDRERTLVGVTVLVAFVLIVGGSVLWANGKLKSKKFALKDRQEKLSQILSLESAYKKQQKTKRKDAGRLDKNNITLSPYLEGITRELGLKLENIKARTVKVKETGYEQELVDVTFKGLSINALHDLVKEVEGPKSKGVVKVVKMNVSTRHDDDKKLNAKLTIATWKKG